MRSCCGPAALTAINPASVFQFFHFSELTEDQIFGDLLSAELNVTLSSSPTHVMSTCVHRFEASGGHLWPAKVRAAVLQPFPKSISEYFPAAVPEAPKTQLQKLL